MTRVDIVEPLYEICRRLDLEPRYVALLEIRPRKVVAELYLKRNGGKYLADDGEAATVQKVFEVDT